MSSRGPSKLETPLTRMFGVRAPILSAVVGAVTGETPKGELIRALMSAPMVE